MRRCLAASALALAALTASGGLPGCGDGGEGTASTASGAVADSRDSARRPAPRPARPKAGPIRLGKGLEGDVTYVARVKRTALARSAPRGDAPVWMQIATAAPYSGRRQHLMVTGAYRDRRGKEWVRVQIALRPNGSTAWVARDDVALTATHWRVKVDLSERRLRLYRDGRLVATHRAGVGMAQYPTPTGLFAIEDALPSRPDWRPKYGSHVLTLTAYSNVLTSFMGGEGQSAIHGTGSLGRVGTASSFGCVVLGPAALAALYERVTPGTPVEISA